MHDPAAQRDVSSAPFWRSRYGLGWLVLAAVAAWFLLAEHRAHLFGALPWLILLACPLMHVFMHRGQHPHQRPPSSTGADATPPPPGPDKSGAQT